MNLVFNLFIKLIGTDRCNTVFHGIVWTPYHLTVLTKCLALWVKFSVDDILKYFSDFSQKTGFDISCKFSLLEKICMECQRSFSGKNKKNITNLSSAELVKRVVMVRFESVS